MGVAARKLKVRAFGITREILGGRDLVLEIDGQTVADLRNELLTRYQELTGLKSLMIAINNTYAEDSQIIHDSDEIALIPPVSGG